MEQRFEELVRSIASPLRKITYRLGFQGQASMHHQDDLYQEALIFLWDKYQSGVLADKTKSYILQGCFFHLKNFLRTHCNKAAQISLDVCMNEDGQEFDLAQVLEKETSEPLFETVNCKMIVEAIRNNGLTPREKEVFLLGLEGLTTRQIGSRLGVSHVRVVTLRKSMREKCRKHLDAEVYRN